MEQKLSNILFLRNWKQNKREEVKMHQFNARKSVEEQLRKLQKQVDQQEGSYLKAKENEAIRNQAFQEKGCQQIYRKIINYCGGFKVVRPGMKAKVKQHAITCYLKGLSPDLDKFREQVTRANEINQERYRKTVR
jgi:hypothetical protein